MHNFWSSHQDMVFVHKSLCQIWLNILLHRQISYARRAQRAQIQTLTICSLIILHAHHIDEMKWNEKKKRENRKQNNNNSSSSIEKKRRVSYPYAMIDNNRCGGEPISNCVANRFEIPFSIYITVLWIWGGDGVVLLTIITHQAIKWRSKLVDWVFLLSVRPIKMHSFIYYL